MAKKKSKKKNLKKKDSKKKSALKKKIASRKDKKKEKKVAKKKENKKKGKKIKAGKKKQNKSLVTASPVADHSSNYNVQNAISRIRDLKSKSEVQDFIKGEERITIMRVIPAVIKKFE